MGFKGSLDTFNLADVFQNLSLNQQTGTLRLVAGSGACRNVYFASGHIKYLDRGDDKPLIPAEAFAVRGLASREQLDHAIAKASETGRPVGECLIDIGACSREQVDALFQHQIEEDIYELFGWEKADFEFTEGDPGAGRFADQVGFTKNVKIQVSGLIMEAARRIDEWERIRQQIPSPKEVYVFEESAAKAVAGGEIELDPIERRVFSLMDGIRDVGDLIADSCLSAFEVAKALSGFLQNGMIRPARVEELRAAAEKCEKAGERVKCIKLYERILAVGGEDVGIRKALAEACVAAGNAEKAAIHMNVLAEAALKEGDEEKALGVLRRIVQLIPRHAPSRERLAEIYARRDQKREAIINYQELCSIYQEGGRIAEARAACVRALELDPSHVDIRNELVKLCLLDNDRAAACRELEIMGDLYARAGRVKQAAETYRRILSMDHSLTQVKTKLSNVLLSEDEKRQRRVIIRTVLAAIALAILAAGGLGLYEYVNFREYERRMDAARDMELEAEGLLRAGKYDAAAARYREAAGAAAAARTLNSPFLALDRKAGERESKLLADARDAEEKAAEARAREQERIKSLISDIEKHEKAYELAEAISKCRDVIGSEYAEGPQKDSCSEKLAELTKKKREIEDFLSFMRVGTPDPAEEYRKKTEFLGKYPDHPECPRVRLPLTISALTGEADVVFDGALVGVAGERPLRIEYDPGKRHALEVRREGYRSYKRSFQTLETWELKVALARETAWKFSAKLNPNETIAAETGFSAVDRVFFIGTSEGAVVAVREGMDAELWRVAGRGGLGGEVVGKVHFVREGAADGGVLIFGVQRGEVVAYSLASGVKSPVWSASCAEPLQAGLSVEPVTLFGG
ncbi:MAG: DUF4388 domain-containing protein, partial [Planctomycetota bacterium]|nr:DUF4388 domain-containing protein [Planctomycetota bacterium]